MAVDDFQKPCHTPSPRNSTDPVSNSITDKKKKGEQPPSYPRLAICATPHQKGTGKRAPNRMLTEYLLCRFVPRPLTKDKNLHRRAKSV